MEPSDSVAQCIELQLVAHSEFHPSPSVHNMLCSKWHCSRPISSIVFHVHYGTPHTVDQNQYKATLCGAINNTEIIFSQHRLY